MPVSPNYIASADAFFSGFEPGPLAEHLSKHTPIPIPYQEPVDWARWATVAIGLLGFAITLKMLSSVFLNRWSWALGTVIVSLVMTSGYMFTRIRGTPYSGADGNWIAAGYQNQFGQEVHVVAFICTPLSSFCIVTSSQHY